jgi:hypothetical protein
MWAHGHNRKGASFTLSDEARDKIRRAQLANNSMAGKPSWNRGGTHSDSARMKIREARANQVFSHESRIKKSQTIKAQWDNGIRTRQNCPFYVDGRHKGKTPIKQSLEYRLWRTAVFERDNYTCTDCGIRGGSLQADHIKPQSIFPELRFALENGRTLCRDCHKRTPTWGLRVVQRGQHTTSLLLAIIN